MEVVVPLAVVCVLAVSGAPNATRPRRPDALPDEPLLPDDDDDHRLDYYDEERINISEKGMYLGSPCEFSCNSKLVHVFCEPTTATCQCDPKHPVALGVAQGCAKAKKLGEQCFYRQTCRAFDAHSSCVQVNHNAYCQCESGYHSTSHSRPTHRVFCTEDLVLLTADMPTLLGVASGIFVLGGLLCMVLHLYTRARFHPTHLADARLTPPCLYSLNDTGGTMSATRASSRASSRSGCTSGTLELESCGSRRVSRRAGGGGAGGGGGGVPVSASRAGAARTAAILLISRHLKAVRRDGGAHPPKCAAKAEKRQQLRNFDRFATSKSKFGAEQFIVYKELQREAVGAREGAEREATDEHASRSAARQDGRRTRRAQARAHALAALAQHLHGWPAPVFNGEPGPTTARSGWTLLQHLALLTAGSNQNASFLGLFILRWLTSYRLDVNKGVTDFLKLIRHCVAIEMDLRTCNKQKS